MIKIEQPNIKINGKTYWQVACKKCQRADKYRMFYDGGDSFAFRCECGNTTELDKLRVQNKPDEKPIELRHIL